MVLVAECDPPHIIYGFIKTANYIVKAKCVNGFIELKIKMVIRCFSVI
tara:strand:+ start:1606 stop:1749 length:144 start_codon:yes stop_codon:yes gene_type:complete